MPQQTESENSLLPPPPFFTSREEILAYYDSDRISALFTRPRVIRNEDRCYKIVCATLGCKFVICYRSKTRKKAIVGWNLSDSSQCFHDGDCRYAPDGNYANPDTIALELAPLMRERELTTRAIERVLLVIEKNHRGYQGH
jgi:hypothetical protein